MVVIVTKSITAENIWSGALTPKDGLHGGGLNISISGTWVATITLQRSFDLGVTWHEVTTYEANMQKALVEPEHGVQYRIGVKTGEFTSGIVEVRLSL